MARAGSVTTRGSCLSLPVLYELIVAKTSFEFEHPICWFMPSFTSSVHPQKALECFYQNSAIWNMQWPVQKAVKEHA